MPVMNFPPIRKYTNNQLIQVIISLMEVVKIQKVKKVKMMLRVRWKCHILASDAQIASVQEDKSERKLMQ